ncbi:MAG: protein-disulfide reductase DsbD [Chromatiales bacterium]|jgi:thiol:disulfide interchange protein DsbD
MHNNKKLISLLWFGLLALLLGAPGAYAIDEDELLTPKQAFPISADGSQSDKIRVKWRIAEGYYLYQSKIKFTTESSGLTLETPNFPPAEIKHDDFFGDVSIYRDEVIIEIPVKKSKDAPQIITLHAKSQGCADIGVCFPPQTQTVLVAMTADADRPPPVDPNMVEEPEASGTGDPSTNDAVETESVVDHEENPSSSRDALAALSAFGEEIGIDAEEDDLLTPEQAYQLSYAINNDRLELNFQIAEGTYLYYDKLKLKLPADSDLQLGDFQLPEPETKEDSVRPDGSIGPVDIYHGSVSLSAPLINNSSQAGTTELSIHYQGCAERGICYPPITKTVQLDYPAAGQGSVSLSGDAITGAASTTVATTDEAETPASSPASADSSGSEEDRIASVIKSSGSLAVIGIFFAIGLGLAFTPCVFPMIPILSGIITGQGENITTRKAAFLSTVYVLAMAITYTAAGVFAAMSGENLQILLQIPWVIALFALIFVLLALSMFGFYELQLPSSLQSKITEISNKQSGGNVIGVAIMGFLSALIVGPCVAPPLAGALLYISQTNDPILGGLALFAMSMGMGTPLILIGASAGKLLPRAGGWMDTVKAVFGVSMLGLAIYFLERILPESVILLLWGLLLISSAVYMGALTQLPIEASGWSKLWKSLGIALLIYGALLLVGAAADSKDVRQPLRGIAFSSGTGHAGGPAVRHFERITTMQQLDDRLAQARAAGKPAVLDFYADWCTYCKTMEKEIFPAPDAQAALANAVLIQADVTDAGSPQAKALMQRFGVIAPPVLVFWDAEGNELKQHKIVGDVTLEQFVNKTRKAIQ